MKRLLLGHILPGVLITILLLSFAEVIFRFFPSESSSSEDEPIIDFIEPDKELLWRLKPYSTGPLKTNELGLRDKPFKKKRDYTILVLGDSVSWGDQIHDINDPYPQRLEEKLNQVLPGYTVEVVNAGVPGYSTFQELAYLKSKGLSLKPDMILIQFCLNDVIERYETVAEYGGNDSFLGVETTGKGLLKYSVMAQKVIKWAQKRARANQEYTIKGLTEEKMEPHLTEAWKLTMGELKEIFTVAQKNSIPIKLVAAPYRFQLDDPQNSDLPQKRLYQIARSMGVTMIDILPPFSVMRKDLKESLFHDENHFTYQGHEIAAHMIARVVLPDIKEAIQGRDGRGSDHR